MEERTAFDLKNEYEIVVNINVTERCNYHCLYCFGTWGLEDSGVDVHGVFRHQGPGRSVISELVSFFENEHGVRINFVGGEPALLPGVRELIEGAREGGARTSYVTNGLMLRNFPPEWTAANIDRISVSVDSIKPATNLLIGRATRSATVFDAEQVVSDISAVRAAGRSKRVEVVVNTVVSALNSNEDFAGIIEAIDPDRWSIFKMLPVYTESQVVSNDDFIAFVERHRKRFGTIMFPEDNEQMTGSYVMVDPLSRFFWYSNNPEAGYDYSRPIVEVGVEAAWESVSIDLRKYSARYRRALTDT